VAKPTAARLLTSNVLVCPGANRLIERLFRAFSPGILNSLTQCRRLPQELQYPALEFWVAKRWTSPAAGYARRPVRLKVREVSKAEVERLAALLIAIVHRERGPERAT
jgi:hypothetical protein